MLWPAWTGSLVANSIEVATLPVCEAAPNSSMNWMVDSTRRSSSSSMTGKCFECLTRRRRDPSSPAARTRCMRRHKLLQQLNAARPETGRALSKVVEEDGRTESLDFELPPERSILRAGHRFAIPLLGMSRHGAPMDERSRHACCSVANCHSQRCCASRRGPARGSSRCADARLGLGRRSAFCLSTGNSRCGSAGRSPRSSRAPRGDRLAKRRATGPDAA